MKNFKVLLSAVLLAQLLLAACSGVLAAPVPVVSANTATPLTANKPSVKVTPAPAATAPANPVSPPASTVPAAVPPAADIPAAATPEPVVIDENSDGIIAALFEEKKSDVQVAGEGTVIKILADDNDGSRHQRFILELSSGHTLLMAHNIDIAPRLDGLAEKDTLQFYGEYYYNEQGGGVHWTHHDPDGEHIGGWLKWNEVTYE